MAMAEVGVINYPNTPHIGVFASTGYRRRGASVLGNRHMRLYTIKITCFRMRFFVGNLCFLLSITNNSVNGNVCLYRVIGSCDYMGVAISSVFRQKILKSIYKLICLYARY